MLSRTFRLLAIAGLATSALWAADDPFVGEWKLDPSKSKLTDQMKVESVAGNKYAFDFGGGAETIATDGTAQPVRYDTTLSVTIEAPDAWKVVRKKEGRVLLTANWQLSKDGNMLTDNFNAISPNGSTSTVVSEKRTGIRFRGHVGKHERGGELRLCAPDPAIRG